MLESLAIDAYNEFYIAHKELFLKNPVEYWHQASQYKRDKIREYMLSQERNSEK